MCTCHALPRLCPRSHSLRSRRCRRCACTRARLRPQFAPQGYAGVHLKPLHSRVCPSSRTAATPALAAWLASGFRAPARAQRHRRHACRAHLEEDAGKNMHGGGGEGPRHSLVDLNRAGVPLLEIVTEPEFASGAEAAAYGAELRRIVRFLGISDGNMQVRQPASPPPPDGVPAMSCHGKSVAAIAQHGPAVHMRRSSMWWGTHHYPEPHRQSGAGTCMVCMHAADGAHRFSTLRGASRVT